MEERREVLGGGAGQVVGLMGYTINTRLRTKALWLRNAVCEKSSQAVEDTTIGAGARYTT